MTYNIQVIRAGELKTTLWSGGTTTEIAIYPKEASYSQRNFTWRLSSAKVEAEESDFTILPGIERIIMIIEGELTLNHQGHHSCVLKPFEQDKFSGDWKTKSIGKVVDFNLMMAEGCVGKLEAIHINGNQLNKICISKKSEFSKMTQALYCINGDVSIRSFDEETIILHKGDALLISFEGNFDEIDMQLHNETGQKVDLIKASIWY
jgi:environmental stress-induced protein Ves